METMHSNITFVIFLLLLRML